MRSDAEIIIPPLFRCPISLDLFKDPVTLRTGQTYDRSCIEKWLAAGNSTCPVTMQKLPDPSLVPNHTLKHLIHNWLYSSGYSDPDPLDRDLETRLRETIESDDEFSKVVALEEILALSQGLPLENSFLIKHDFFRIVTEQLSRDAEKNIVLVEKALQCAVKLMPFSEVGCLDELLPSSVMLRLFERGNDSIKKSLCFIIEAIALNPQTEELSVKLGQSPVVRAVIDAVKDCIECSEAGVRALWALSLTESNRGNMAARGGVEVLVECLWSSTEAMAMAAIENLLMSEVGAKELLLRHPLGVKAVVRMVFKVSEHEGSESAVNALAVVCSDSEGARERAIGDGVLTQLLLLLQSQCSGRTKSKARMLLNVLGS